MLDIRKYYSPVQPSVKTTQQDVVYVELLPEAALQPYIYCYWSLSRTAPLPETFNYRVVADGCIDIFFELGNSAYAEVMGFCNRFTEFPLEGSFRYFGVRFFPSVFPQLFDINAKVLSNDTTPLADLAPITANFIATQIHSGQDLQQISTLLDGHFRQLLSQTNFDDDKRFDDALEMILASNGAINVDTELDTGISARQLQRRFEYFTGTTAKTFARVVRFQAMLSKVNPSKGNRVFLDLGYYDQSHFIKEFRALYGMTPAKVLRA